MQVLGGREYRNGCSQPRPSVAPLVRIIIDSSLHPGVIRQAIGTELRFQKIALWDRLVKVSDIPLRQRADNFGDLIRSAI
jgi:hypothetical protein